MSRLEILLAQPLSTAIAWAMIHFVWQGAIVAAALALVLRLGRRWTAEARYALSCAGLIALLVLPIATTIGWTARGPGGEALTGLEALFLEPGPEATSARGVTAGDTFGEVAADPSAASDSAASPGSALAAGLGRMRSRIAAFLEPVLPWILVGWLAGVLVITTRSASQRLVIRKLRRESRAAAPELQRRLEALAARFGLRRPVALRLIPRVSSPAVIGWVRPVILFPPALLLRLTPTQLELILAHELAHIRRHDYAVSLLQTIVETLLFFHPVVWWVSRRVRVEREHACDGVAVGLTGDPVGYARALTEVASAGIQPGPAPGLAFLGTKGTTLMDRVERILGIERPTPPESGAAAGTLVSVLTLAAALFLSQGAIAPVASAQDATTSAAAIEGRLEILERANMLRGRDAADVLDLLDDGDPLTRAAAARVLGEANFPPAADALMTLLRDGSAAVRKDAAVALGIMSYGPAQSPLVDLLDDRDPGVREQAAYAIAIIGSDHAPYVEPVLELVDDPVASVRAGVARALGFMGDRRAVRPLIDLIEDPVESVRRAAVRALGYLDTSGFDPSQDPRSGDPESAPRRGGR